MDDAKYYRYRLDTLVFRTADYPGEDVEEAITAQGDKVEAVDDGRYGSLT